VNGLRLAVIGVGHLGRIHARLARELDDARLVAVADTRAQARKQVAADTGTRAVADFRELLGQIDAAIVATPTETHHDVVLELLAAGVHVFVEKPIAANVAQADAMVEAARRAGVVLQVGHIERFNPALQRVLPQTGDPKYIDAVRISGFPFRSLDIGVVLDLMIHDLDIAMSLTGSPVANVDSLGVCVLDHHEDVAQARLVFENGCVANFTASRVSYRSQRVMQIWSSEGFAAVDFAMRNSTLVRPHPDVLERRLSLDALAAEERNRLKTHLFDEVLARESIEGAEGNALLEEQRDFVAAIREERAPRICGAQGRDVLSVAERILAGIAEHQWDGHPAGRVGPHLMPPGPILRPVFWTDDQSEAQRRQAG